MEVFSLTKLKAHYSPGQPVSYYLMAHQGQEIHLNEKIGSRFGLEFTGDIHCTHCGRKTKKSFQQGYCFPCTRRLPETDICMVRPEKCHFDQGSCRDEAWGQEHCFIKHTVYLANSSGLKVGITRQAPIQRWLDQGASQGLALLEVASRKAAGILEVALKARFNDKTDWRRMLKGIPEPIELQNHAAEVLGDLSAEIPYQALKQQAVDITYPVQHYPTKVSSLSFDKTAVCQGTLQGIKGQYLIFDTGVLNIKKFAGYQLKLTEPL